MDIKFKLDGMECKYLPSKPIVAKSQNYLTAYFELATDDWQPPITALFNDHAVVLDELNSCTVPWEATEKAGSMKVTAFCGTSGDASYLHTASCALVSINESCYSKGKVPIPPTPDLVQQSIAAGIHADKAATAADAAAKRANDAASKVGACANQPIRKATGELIAVNDAFRDKPLALSVEGKTSKNLWQPTGQTGMLNEINWDVKPDGSVHIKGTITGGYDNNGVSEITSLEVGKTYTLDCLGSSNKLVASVRIEYEDGSRDWWIAEGKPITFTVSDSKPIKTVYLQTTFIGAEVGKEYDVTLYPMLVEGSTPQPWTPSGLTCVKSAEIEIAGKNLFITEMNPFSEGGFTVNKNANGSISLSGQCPKDTVFNIFGKWNAQGNSYLKSGNTYTISGTKVANCDIQVHFFKDGQFLESVTTYSDHRSYTFTPPVHDGLHVTLRVKAGDYNSTVYPQIEVGSTATPYEPYQGSTLPIDLKSNKLCSLPDGVHDELRVTREGDRGHVELVKRTAELTITKDRSWGAYPQPTRGVYRYDGRITDTPFKYSNSGWFEGYDYNVDYENMAVGEAYIGTSSAIFATKYPTLDEFLAAFPADGIKAIAYARQEKTIDLGYIDLPELPAPNTTVWSSTNLPAVTSSVEYVQDINVVLAQLMQQILSAPTN